MGLHLYLIWWVCHLVGHRLDVMKASLVNDCLKKIRLVFYKKKYKNININTKTNTSSNTNVNLNNLHMKIFLFCLCLCTVQHRIWRCAENVLQTNFATKCGRKNIIYQAAKKMFGNMLWHKKKRKIMTMMIVLLKKQLDNEQRQTGGCSWVLTASGTIYLDNEMDSIHLCTLYTLISTNTNINKSN